MKTINKVFLGCICANIIGCGACFQFGLESLGYSCLVLAFVFLMTIGAIND